MSWSAFIDHLNEFHPNDQSWGDQGTGADMWCQACGAQYLKNGQPVSKEDIIRQPNFRPPINDQPTKET